MRNRGAAAKADPRSGAAAVKVWDRQAPPRPRRHGRKFTGQRERKARNTRRRKEKEETKASVHLRAKKRDMYVMVVRWQQNGEKGRVGEREEGKEIAVCP